MTDTAMPAEIRSPGPAGGPRGITRALVLVALAMLWNYASDVLSDRLGIETESFASPWKFPLIALGTLVTYGGVVGLGTVVWGRTSLRGIGWTFDEPRRLVLVGLLQTALLVAMVFAAYGILGGLEGVRELCHALVTLPIGQRVFFALMGVKIAFFEESLFRGDLIRSLLPRTGPATAAVVSSLVFAIYHRTLDPVPLVMKVAMGLVFSFFAIRTRSLVPSAIAHALLWAIVCDN